MRHKRAGYKLKRNIASRRALFKGLVNQAGAAVLVAAASTGGFVLSGLDLAAVLPYRWLRVVCGVNQTAPRLFTVTRKISRSDPLA